jgi:mRNA-degrading endonuclease toxin of MazEF toxin-antitoxin module
MVARGEVWWGPALFKGGDVYRPWLVLSDDSHPFADEECIAVGLTTTEHAAGIRIDADEWASGGTPRRSYVSPWYCATLKHVDLDRHQGSLSTEFVSRVAHELAEYVGVTHLGP